MQQRKWFYLDVLRGIACLSVVMIHASAGFAVSEVGKINYYVGTLFDSLSRIGVPLFVMISGALLLDENYDCTRKKIERHISKMLLFFVFWSSMYAIAYDVVLPLIQNNPINVAYLLRSIVEGHYHLWFVPMIIGLYLVVPLLRLWVKKSNVEYIKYYLLLSLIFAFVIPQVIDVLSVFAGRFELISFFQNMNMKYVLGYVSYFVLGWYLNNCTLKHKKVIFFLGIGGVMITIAGTCMLSLCQNKVIELFYSNFSCNVLFYAIMVFSMVKDSFFEYSKKKRFYRFINLISNHSLGIYAMHSAFITLFSVLCNRYVSNYAIIEIPIIFVLSLMFSLLGSIVMKKLPMFRRLV